jgi:hypothetical protein
VFVGSIGFIAATEFAVSTMTAQPDWIIVLIGFVAGIIGAVLALIFQAGAIAVAGLLGGAYLGLVATRYLSISSQSAQTIAAIVGAVLGLVLMILLFDSALITISSILGALILADKFELGGWLFFVAAAILALLGILAQTNQTSPSEPGYA